MAVKTKVFHNTFRADKASREAGTPFTATVLVPGVLVEHRHFAGEGEATKWARARKRELAGRS